VTVPESDLPRGRNDNRLSAVSGGGRAAGNPGVPGQGHLGGPLNGYPKGAVTGTFNGINGLHPGPANGSVPVPTNPFGIAVAPMSTAGTGPNPLGPNPLGPNPLGPNPLGPNPLGPNPVSAGPAPIGTVSGVRTSLHQGAATATLATRPPSGRPGADVLPEAPPSRPSDPGPGRQGARRANRPVRSASAAAAVVTRPAWVFGGWLLRDGVRPLLLGADVLACGIATAVISGGQGQPPHWTVLLFGLLLVSLYALGGLYRSRLSLSLLDDLPRIVGRWLAALALTVLVQAVRARTSWGTQDVSWSMVVTAVTALVLLVPLRALAYNFVRIVRSQRRVAHRTLILGAGHVGEQLARTLLKRSEYGLQPIGFVDNHPLIDPDTCAVPLLGGTEDLADVLVREDARNVVVAFGSVRESQMVDIIRTCDRLRCEIFLVPRLFELHQVSEDMDTVWGLPLVRLRRATYRSIAWQVKRIFDVMFAAGSLLVLSPLMLAAAMAVRLEGGPGILFRQERVGADGKRFDVLKFRSLKPANDEESATNWNIKHDDRLGAVGKFLRKSSIDELPQLINILRGEMSLVGPRPERPHFVTQFRQAYPRYTARHRVPSGLTGWAAVHGLRGDTSIADRAMFDNYYIENWSLWLDLKILLRTVSSVIKGTGG
jgi:exopolysaccharide biosynthesis polyprenyl glycosylphosphotransferase